MKRSHMACLIGLLSFIVASGCAFDRRWHDMKRAAVQGQTPQASDPLAGRWQGEWLSDVNGHKGRLRAIITGAAQAAGEKPTYQADFDATFFGFMRAGYSIPLTGEPTDAHTIEFSGSKDLGSMAGGMYEYRGAADGEHFTAHYESKSDHGTFQMTRPGSGE